jgi:2-(1,2-epoxy-1,2-dihydrophenyl)acetyl-CoA isomerase
MSGLAPGEARAGISLELADGVARVVLDRPQLKNALDPESWAALHHAIRGAITAHARVIVVEGRGGAFCAGGNLKNIAERLELPIAERRAQLERDAQAVRLLAECGRPTVAIIDGPALGAGLALALACDVRLCSARSTLGAAFRKVGLAGDFGISWLLPRAVGRGRALDLLYTGRTLRADEAYDLGLVEHVVPDAELAATASAYVAELASGPASLDSMRHTVHAVHAMRFSVALAFEAGAQAEASQTSDAKEGARAFLERRPPRFEGK